MRSLKLILIFILLIGCSRNEVVLHDANNHEILLSQLKGKWIVVNYWADWCESCVAEIPELNHFYTHNKNNNIVLFGVSYDQLSDDQLSQAMQKHKIFYPVLKENPQKIWNLGFIEVIPTTFIINPEGQVAKVIVGATTEKQLTTVLHELGQ